MTQLAGSFAFCGAVQVLGVDRWLAPRLKDQAAAGAGWARPLFYAV